MRRDFTGLPARTNETAIPVLMSGQTENNSGVPTTGFTNIQPAGWISSGRGLAPWRKLPVLRRRQSARASNCGKNSIR